MNLKLIFLFIAFYLGVEYVGKHFCVNMRIWLHIADASASCRRQKEMCVVDSICITHADAGRVMYECVSISYQFLCWKLRFYARGYI